MAGLRLGLLFSVFLISVFSVKVGESIANVRNEKIWESRLQSRLSLLSTECREKFLGYNPLQRNKQTLTSKTTNSLRFIFEANQHLPLVDPSDLPSLGDYDHCRTSGAEISMKYCYLHILVNNIKEYVNNITQGKSKIYKRLENIWLASAFVGICIPQECTKEDAVVFQNAFETSHHNSASQVAYSVLDVTCRDDLNPSELFRWILIIFTGLILLINILPENKFPNILQCFDLKPPLKRLLTQNTPNSTIIESINALRVLSTLWVIYGHVHEVNLYYPTSNVQTIFEWTGSFQSVFVALAPLAVDQFLAITGFLFGYKQTEFKTALKQRIFSVLLPMYPLLFIFHTSLKDFGDGPMWWTTRRHLEHTCSTHWWTSYLLIHNYYNSSAMCAGHTWYLAMDFQLFLISPILLYLLRKCFQMAACFIIVLAMTMCLWTTYIAFSLELDPTPGSWLTDYFTYVYFPTHLRSPVWLISLLIGYIYKENISYKQFRWLQNGRLRRVSSGLVILTTAIFSLYSSYFTIPKVFLALFTGFHRMSWSLVILWLVLTERSFQMTFFSISSRVLSKLSFCMYLTHPLVQLIVIGSRKRPFDFRIMTNVIDVFHQLFYTFLTSLYWYLLIQSPIISLGIYYFAPNKLKDENAKEKFN